MSDQSTQPDCACGLIRPGERIDDLQLQGLRIIQKERGFHFGMDAVLLADFARAEARDRIADFGTGTGIIPLLLAGRLLPPCSFTFFRVGWNRIGREIRICSAPGIGRVALVYS